MEKEVRIGEEPPEEAVAVGLARVGQGERQIDLKSILEIERFC